MPGGIGGRGTGQIEHPGDPLDRIRRRIVRRQEGDIKCRIDAGKGQRLGHGLGKRGFGRGCGAQKDKQKALRPVATIGLHQPRPLGKGGEPAKFRGKFVRHLRRGIVRCGEAFWPRRLPGFGAARTLPQRPRQPVHRPGGQQIGRRRDGKVQCQADTLPRHLGRDHPPG